MSKVSPGFTNFTRGILSPLALARTDYQGYFDGASELTNFFVRVQGPITRRPGFVYVATSGTTTLPIRLIPFEFSTEQAYVLEFGEEYMRVFRDKSIVIDSGTSLPYTITTPYLSSELAELKYTQSADTVYLTHPDHPPYKLTRTGHTAWTLSGVSTEYGPAMDIIPDIAGTTLTSSGVGVGLRAITAPAGTTVFYPGHVGSVWRWDMIGGTSGYFTVTAYGSPTAVSGLVGSELNALTSAAWGEASWSDYRGWPYAVKFHEDRLIYGGSDHMPTTIWASVVGEYDNFFTGETDSCALSLTTQNLNAIRWMESTEDLIVGTTGGVLKISGKSDGGALTYEATCKTQSRKGCADIMAEIVGEAILYVSRSKRKVHELAYSLERDGYVAPNRTIVAENITESGIVETAYQGEPDSVLWCVLNNGKMAAFTYEPDEKILAWSGPHETDGNFKSICVIPGSEEEEVWVAVERNGVYMVEYMAPISWDSIYDCFFVDSGLSRTGAGTTTLQITGLDHLAGRTIDILVDGTAHPQKVVSATGGVTLNYAGTTIHAGLSYTSTYRSVNLEGGSYQGTAIGKTKRIISVVVRFLETVAGKIGYDDNDLTDIPFRTEGVALYGGYTEPFTGDKKMLFKHGYDTEAYVQVVQDKPLPMTILSVIPLFDVRDR